MASRQIDGFDARVELRGASRAAAYGLWALLAVAGGSTVPALRAGERLIVVQPGFPGSTEDAAPFMRRFAAVLGPRAASRELEAVYYNEPDEALADLRKKGATVGIVSVGFYLSHRKEFRLEPLAELEPEGRYRLLVPSGFEGGTDGLRDAAVVGGVLYDPEFVRRVAFSHVAGVETWKGTPTVQVTRALRHLARGRYRAILLHDRERETLAKAGALEGYRELAQSDPFPVGLLVAFGAPRGRGETEAGAPGEETESSRDDSTGDVARRFLPAVLALGEDEEGREILETLGCEGSRRARKDRLEKLEKKYDAEKR